MYGHILDSLLGQNVIGSQAELGPQKVSAGDKSMSQLWLEMQPLKARPQDKDKMTSPLYLPRV